MDDRPIGLWVEYLSMPRKTDTIPGRVIPKIQKMILDTSLLYTQVRIKGKRSNPGNVVAPTHTPRWSSY